MKKITILLTSILLTFIACSKKASPPPTYNYMSTAPGFSFIGTEKIQITNKEEVNGYSAIFDSSTNTYYAFGFRKSSFWLAQFKSDYSELSEIVIDSIKSLKSGPYRDSLNAVNLSTPSPLYHDSTEGMLLIGFSYMGVQSGNFSPYRLLVKYEPLVKQILYYSLGNNNSTPFLWYNKGALFYNYYNSLNINILNNNLSSIYSGNSPHPPTARSTIPTSEYTYIDYGLGEANQKIAAFDLRESDTLWSNNILTDIQNNSHVTLLNKSLNNTILKLSYNILNYDGSTKNETVQINALTGKIL